MVFKGQQIWVIKADQSVHGPCNLNAIFQNTKDDPIDAAVRIHGHAAIRDAIVLFDKDNYYTYNNKFVPTAIEYNTMGILHPSKILKKHFINYQIINFIY